jgi:transposase
VPGSAWAARPTRGPRLSEQRKYRSVREVCREHGISETLYYGWRDQLLEAGRERFAGKEERQGERELRRKIAELERTLGKKRYELERLSQRFAWRRGLLVRCRGGRSVEDRIGDLCGGRDGMPPELEQVVGRADQLRLGTAGGEAAA